ncbi:MAG: response regulator [Planctomycetes bacterium]|nr:response regulator [Planctomycetota bacterium]
MTPARPLRCALIAALSCAAVFGAPPARAQSWDVRTLEEADGLPITRIADLAQGPDGRLWVAGRGRLHAFDGVEWTAYGGPSTVPSLNPSFVRVDGLGRVWALPARLDLPVAVFTGDTWSKLPDLSGDDLVARTWTAATPWSRGDAQLLVAAAQGLGVLTTSGETWERPCWGAELADVEVTDLEEQGERLWIATTSGLLCLEAGAKRAEPVPETRGELVHGVCVDPRDGALWFATPRGLGRLDAHGLERIDYDLPELRSEQVPYCGPVVDALGGVYFGNSRKLVRYHPSTGVRWVGHATGLLKDGATALLRDREQNLWVGCSTGLSRIVGLHLAGYDADHGFPESEVTSLLRRRDGQILVGHPYSITWFPQMLVMPLDLPRDARARLLDLEEDARGTLWLAGYGRGLGRVEPSGELAWLRLDTSDEDTTTSVVLDDRERLWVATGKALFRREADGEAFLPVPLPELGEVPENFYLRKLARGANGRVYGATSRHGLFAFEVDGSVQRWVHGAENVFDNVYAVLEDEDDVWVGTRGGLCRARNGRLEPFPDALHGNRRAVYSLLLDASGALWLGTDDGLQTWDGAAWRRLTVEDGLVAREANRDATLLDERGRLWFGTEGGLAIYDPSLEVPARPAPLVALRAVDVDGVSSPADAPVPARADHNSVVFHFRGTSFVDERGLLYRYRLAPYEQEWSEPARIPGDSVRYTNLPPGEYTFELQARGVEQPWSDVARSSPLEVPHLLWTRPWFLGLAALVGALLSAALVRTAGRLRYTQRLEREVQRRLEENRALEVENERAHRLEALGVLAGGVAHDFNNLLTVISGSFVLLQSAPRPGLDRHEVCADGLAAAHRARALTQQLLTFSRGGAPLLRAASVAELVRESVRFALRGSDLVAECELPDDLWPASMDPDQISQVLSNLLVNAKQASPAGGRVRVRGRNCPADGELSAPYVEIEVADEGSGIPASELGRIFDPYYSTKSDGSGLGLATAHSIVRRHGGRLTVSSTPGRGSAFRVQLPAATEAPADAPAPRDVVDARHRACRVLVMDDDDAVRETLGRMLSLLDHEVELVHDGAEAVARWADARRAGRPFDLVLLDLTVRGGVGGCEALRRLRALDPDVRAVVISGYSNEAVLADFDEHGFAARLPKPVHLDELQGVLDSVLPEGAAAAQDELVSR